MACSPWRESPASPRESPRMLRQVRLVLARGNSIDYCTWSPKSGAVAESLDCDQNDLRTLTKREGRSVFLPPRAPTTASCSRTGTTPAGSQGCALPSLRRHSSSRWCFTRSQPWVRAVCCQSQPHDGWVSSYCAERRFGDSRLIISLPYTSQTFYLQLSWKNKRRLDRLPWGKSKRLKASSS